MSKTYIAVGPYGWGKASSIKEAQRLCLSNSQKLALSEEMDVFETDPQAYVSNMGTLKGSSITRVGGRGQFMTLHDEEDPDQSPARGG